jgi:hypothetical protein
MDCIAKFRAALLILAFVPSLSRAADPWETTDYALAGAALTALAGRLGTNALHREEYAPL